MSTRSQPPTRARGSQAAAGAAALRALAGVRPDPVEEVAHVASSRRGTLLRAYRHRLRREDLEDCYGQATLELMLMVRRGGEFASLRHLANTLEQRFVSRICDRRRALSGRSPIAAALEGAARLSAGAGERGAAAEVADARAELEQQVLLRLELARVLVLAEQLSPDQRLVLACQVGLQMECGEFCARFGWSQEKYRKVAQRGRARLRALMALDDAGVPPRTGGSDQDAGTSYEHVTPHS